MLRSLSNKSLVSSFAACLSMISGPGVCMSLVSGVLRGDLEEISRTFLVLKSEKQDVGYLNVLKLVLIFFLLSPQKKSFQFIEFFFIQFLFSLSAAPMDCATGLSHFSTSKETFFFLVKLFFWFVVKFTIDQFFLLSLSACFANRIRFCFSTKFCRWSWEREKVEEPFELLKVHRHKFSISDEGNSRAEFVVVPRVEVFHFRHFCRAKRRKVDEQRLKIMIFFGARPNKVSISSLQG